MTKEDVLTDIFGAEIAARSEIEGLILHVFDNGLLYVQVKEFYIVDKDVLHKAQAYLQKLTPQKRYHFIFEFANFSDVDPEMRKQRATSEGTLFSLSDAIVISNFPQKIIGDFYIRFNQPVRPTKFFFSLEKAVQWSLKTQRNMKPLK